MHPILGRSVIHVRGSKWKSVRSCLSPGFTTLKLKLMLDHIAEVSDVFMDVLGKKADLGKQINVLETMQGLTMDYLGRAAFGIDTSFQKDLNNPIFVTAKRTVKELMTGPFHMLAQSTTSLGVLAAPIFWLNWIFGTFSFLRSSVETAKVIELRRKNPELRKNDLLQTLIDAEYEEEATQTPSDKTTNGIVKGEQVVRQSFSHTTRKRFVASDSCRSLSLSPASLVPPKPRAYSKLL
ncbi:cytochrome P450 3A8-like [Ixodes scapularis]